MTDNVYTPGAQDDENPAETTPETTQFEAHTAENVSSATDAPQPAETTPAPAAAAAPAAPAAQPKAHTPAATQPPAQAGPFNYAAPQQAAPAAAPAQHAQYTPYGAHPTQPTEPYFRPQTDAFGNPIAAPVGAGPSLGTEPTGSAASAAPKRRSGLALGAALAIGALIGGASGAGVTAIWAANQQSTVTGTNADGNGSVVVNDSESVNEITAVAAKAAPSVVTLQVAGESAAGSGSGVILSEDGYVLTNTHVVTLDGQSSDPTIQVTTADGTIYTATIVGTDPIYDLAVVKLEGATGLTPIEFADSDKLNVGDTAIAIGAPLGLSGTVTNGIVSALNRSITVASSAVPETTEQAPDSGDGSAPFDFWNFDNGQGTTPEAPTQQQGSGSISLSVIQTDAAINPGNSGGALVDSAGKLIGINVAIAGSESSSGQAGNIGVGFSIPSNIAQRISEELIASGEATHGLLGASVTDAEADAAATTTGALIKEISGGGAAEAAGLKAGDVVTNFGGVPITSANDLTAQVRGHASGSEVELRYVRGGDVFTATVTLGALSI